MSRPARKRRAFDWSAAVIAALAIGSAIFVFIRDGQARFLEILTEDVALFGTMLPKVLAGCLIGAFVTLLLPRETIARWVGAESGIAGILVATLAGAILPGGPFTIYPVAAAFLVAGADAGAEHARSAAIFLSGGRPQKNAVRVGVTVDQLVAEHISQDTPLPSLELGIEEASLSCGAATSRL